MNEGIFESRPRRKPVVEVVEVSRPVLWYPGATHVSFLLIGGGGGGGNGRYDTTTTNSIAGGSGGGGGGLQYRRRMPYQVLQALTTTNQFFLSIGAGGTGAASHSNDQAAGNNGTAGGVTQIRISSIYRVGLQNGGMDGYVQAGGGGKGNGGNLSNVNSDTGTAYPGQVKGHTGGQGQNAAGGGNYGNGGNELGSNPSHYLSVAAGTGSGSRTWTSLTGGMLMGSLYVSGTSQPTGTAGDRGTDSRDRAEPLWNLALEQFQEAPFLEELWWFVTAGGGTNGLSGGTVARGGRGGDGWRGTGGGGGGSSNVTGNGQGGNGGNGVAVFWWETLS